MFDRVKETGKPYPSDILHDYIAEQNWRVREIKMHRSAGGGNKVEVLTWNYNENSPRQGELF